MVHTCGRGSVHWVILLGSGWAAQADSKRRAAAPQTLRINLSIRAGQSKKAKPNIMMRDTHQYLWVLPRTLLAGTRQNEAQG
jgi:hypothetical protein